MTNHAKMDAGYDPCEVVRSEEWEGDPRVNFQTAINAGRRIAKQLDQTEDMLFRALFRVASRDDLTFFAVFDDEMRRWYASKLRQLSCDDEDWPFLVPAEREEHLRKCEQ